MTLKGPFVIWYQNKPVKLAFEGGVPISWTHAKTNKEATQIDTMEAARTYLEAIQFPRPKDAEIAPAAYDGKDHPGFD
jgi:hypothetical protein